MNTRPLKIGILTFHGGRPRLGLDDLMIAHAARKMGHNVKTYFTKHFQFTFNNNELGLLYKSKTFNPPDVIITRPNILVDVDLHLAIVKHLQLMGVRLFNKSLSISRAKNKLRTFQILAHHNLPIPKTVVLNNVEYIDRSIDMLGSFPLIMKLSQGSFGNGVSILESKRSMRSMLDLVIASSQTRTPHILIQEYVREAKGTDMRVFVVGGKIIAAMERKAPRGEFRANFQKGGSVALVDLTPEEKKISLAAAEVLGLEVAGVDIIRTQSGPKILEVNSNPGTQGITLASGVDVSAAIVEYAVEKCKLKGSHVLVE